MSSFAFYFFVLPFLTFHSRSKILFFSSLCLDNHLWVYLDSVWGFRFGGLCLPGKPIARHELLVCEFFVHIRNITSTATNYYWHAVYC